MTPPSTLAQQIYEQVRGEVVTGRLPAGAPLTEEDLAERLSASRTPIREALVRLELEGYAERGPQNRLMVRRTTPREIEEWFEVRELIETYAARRAIERISDSEIAELSALVEKDVQALIRGRVDQLALLNERIHGILYRASRNRILVGLLTRMQGRVFGLSAFAVGAAEQQEAFVREHAAMVRFLSDGSGPEAAEVMRQHLWRARDTLIAGLRLASSPDENAGPGQSTNPLDDE